MAEVAAPNGRLDGKVAVVTGAASGIGRATVERFVAEGCRVVAGDLDRVALATLGEELGDAVVTVAGDASVEGDVEQLFATAVERLGRLDVAFANAGIGSIQRIVDMDLAEWRRVLDVNLTGPLLAIKHAAPRMVSGGSIIVTASLNAVQAGVGMGAYSTSKAGVSMLVQVAAMELGPAGIRVNAIGPGFVRTPLTEGAFLMSGVAESYVENTPLGRHARPEEIAGMATYLASDEAGFVSGSLHLIDGAAHTMRYPDIPGILGM